jgi:glutamate carboxypeptidase
MARTPESHGLLGWLGEHEAEMLALLARLVSVNSHSLNKRGVDAVARLLRTEAENAGFAVEVHGGSRLGDNMVFYSKACGESESRILLCGHMDTVFPPDSGFTTYSEDAERAYGPGVIDMKGGLVAGLYALKALDAHGALDDLPVAFVFNSDEEIGSPDSRELILEEAKRAAMALVFECSGPEGETVTGRKGKAGFRLAVTGKAGHSGNLAGDKPSAVLELARKVVALEDLNDPERGLSVNVGRMEGGTGPNSVAAQAEALIDCRYRLAEDRDALMARVAEICAGAGVPGTSNDLQLLAERSPMEPSEGNRILYDMAARHALELGLEIKEDYRGGVSDANLIASAGVPVLDGLGPAGEFDHSPREYMLKSSLAERAALSALTLLTGWLHFGRR